MKKVRCLGCKHVFKADLKGVSKIRCPSCGRKLRVVQLPTSTAGDSMFIDVAKISPPESADLPPDPDALEVDEVEEPVFFCPECAAKLYLDRARYAGKRVTCPVCKKKFLVPRGRG